MVSALKNHVVSPVKAVYVSMPDLHLPTFSIPAAASIDQALGTIW
jgi:hypothetical protein